MRAELWIGLSLGLLPACVEQKVTAFNASPEVTITSHSTDAVVNESMPEIFVAAAQDKDHERSELVARWEVEGAVVCGEAPLDVDGETFCEITLGRGQDAVSVFVEDPMDGVGGATVHLDLAPTDAPSVLLVEPIAERVYYSDQPVRLEAELSDAEDPVEALSAVWRSTAAGELVVGMVPTSDGRVVAHVTLEQGTHGIDVVVTDTTGKTGSDGVDIVVGPPNSAPECEIVLPTDGTVMAQGDSLSLQASAGDVDVPADWLSASWSSDKDGLLDSAATPDSEGLVQTVISGLSVDSHTISLTVTDEVGASCTDDVVVHITEPPQAVILEPVEDGVYYSNHPVRFEGRATDGEDGPEALSTAWRSSLDGPLGVDSAVDSAGFNAGYDLLSEGEHIVAFTVTDSLGVSHIDEVVVQVSGENRAPSCAISNPISGSGGDVADPVMLTGTVDDLDEGPSDLSVRWTSSLDGELRIVLPASDGTVTLAATGLSLGTHTLGLEATDDAGELCLSTVVYTLGVPPDVEILQPTDGEVVDQGDTVTFEGTVSDPDEASGSLVVQWVSDLDGVLHGGVPDATGSTTFTSATLSHGTHTVMLTATDSLGLSTTELITLVSNGIPSAPVVHIEPEGATTTDTLTVGFDAPGVDPEGATLSYRYEWLLDGVSLGSTGAIAPSETLKDQIWTVQVRATDGISEGPPGEASITIANSRPLVDLVQIRPEPLFTDDLASAEVVVSDADGDSIDLDYQWTVDGVVVGEGSTLDGGVYFDKAQVVGLVVSAFDEEGVLDPVEALDLTVQNTAPAAPELVVAPDEPIGRVDDLWCAIETGSTDADGDELSYAFSWTVDDVPWPDSSDTGLGSVPLSTAWSGDTVPAEATAIGEVWTCTVTPQDDEESGTEGEASIVTIEAPPGCGDGTLDPGEELDPAPGPFDHAPVSEETCRYDFTGINQLYCQGFCDYGGAVGCDDADADILCKLITDNPDSEAISYTITAALAAPGFSGVRCGHEEEIVVDRGLETEVGFQDWSLLATHGAGDVVAFPVCTAP
jgi:hypothetical protein